MEIIIISHMGSGVRAPSCRPLHMAHACGIYCRYLPSSMFVRGKLLRPLAVRRGNHKKPSAKEVFSRQIGSFANSGRERVKLRALGNSLGRNPDEAIVIASRNPGEH